MEKPPRRTAIVIGAGIGGVATAARLQCAGFSVTVLEKNDFTGGRCSLLHYEGYRFDQGPSLLLLPSLFRETFHDLGTSLENEGVELLRCDPNYEVFYGDGEKVVLSSDLVKMRAEVQKWEGGEEGEGFERYLAFLQESHRHYELSLRHVLKKNFESWWSMLRPEFAVKIGGMHVFESIYSRASRYFKTERLRRAFTFGTMYLGMSPFDAPGTYSLLQYTELAEGIWYPRGGFHKIVETLVAISQRLGARYRLSTPVTSLIISADQKRATGVLLADGTSLTADLVVVNADLVYSLSTLLPPSRASRTLAARPHSCSSISLYWALSAPGAPALGTHNIFLAEKYRESFDAIFARHQLPTELSFYVNVPSRIDASAAPAGGGDAVVVLVPCGHLTDGEETDWEAVVRRVREEVLDVVLQRTGEDLRGRIVAEVVNTPEVWQEKFNLHRGAILGLSHSFSNVLSFRPSTKHPEIEGCYFVGASTHPGTGVPICLAGAKITAEQILETFGMEAPWRTNVQYHAALKEQRGFVGGSSLVLLATLVIAIVTRYLFLLSGWSVGQ